LIICLTCNSFASMGLTLFLYTIVIVSSLVFITVYLSSGHIYKRVIAGSRVGPHNIDIISVFYGALLGDAHAERRVSGNGTRISFTQESNRVEYLLWLHKLIAELGYCNPNAPKIQSRLGVKGILRYVIRFHTYTYSSLNALHSAWYVDNIKRVPDNIAEFLTPLALAIWIMDDGARVGQGLKLCTNSFTFEDTTRLAVVLNELYGLKAVVQSAGVPNQYIIYIWKESMPHLRELVRKYMVPSMLYKLGE
jgi:ubiquinol-cytochrome c reductase cytochrome b subunit